MDISDEELMRRFQEGNSHAFDVLFEAYRGPVYNFVRRMIGDDSGAAEDVLQEVFAKVVKARDFYEPRAKFSTWLFTIARNCALNVLRSRAYRQRAVTDSLDAAEDGTVAYAVAPDAGPCAAGVGDALATREWLEAAIRALPEPYREVFLLRAVEGLAHSEVSRILNVNPATVRTHYLRARQWLQRRLRRPGMTPPPADAGGSSHDL